MIFINNGTPEQAKPPVNNIKVKHTTEDYQQKTHSTNNQTSTSPPSEPPKKPGEAPKVKDQLPKTSVPNTKEVSSFLKKNNSKIIMGAIGVGIAKSILDKDDDDVLSSSVKGIETGAVAAALSYAGQHMFKTETVQDLVKGEVSGQSKAIRIKQAEQRMHSIGSKLPGALKVGAFAVGAATLLDLGQRAGDKLEAHAMREEQERKLIEKQKKQKARNKEQSYGYIQDGEIVMELFNQRSGHHKMGNAKFN